MNPYNIEKLFSLAGQTVFLTGATGALGTQYSYALAGAGANLILLDVEERALQVLRDDIYSKLEINPDSLRIDFGVCDLRDRKQTGEVVEGLLKKNAPVDVLINNAALTGRTMKDLGKTQSIEDCPEDVWDACLEVNLTEMFLMTKRVLPSMIKRKKGNVINISSIYGNVGPDFLLYEGLGISCPLPYAVTKAGVLNFTRYVANLYGRQGIRCNTLTPGGVQSDLTSEEFVKRYSARTSLGRMARNDDYVGAMLYLCSEASAYVTGSNIIVDGGWTAR